MSGYHIFGVALAVLGVVAAVFPNWFGPLTGGPGPPVDVFEAVERRVRGGMLVGVGLCFIAITALRPWSTSIPTAIFYVMAGALAARAAAVPRTTTPSCRTRPTHNRAHHP